LLKKRNFTSSGRCLADSEDAYRDKTLSEVKSEMVSSQNAYTDRELEYATSRQNLENCRQNLIGEHSKEGLQLVAESSKKCSVDLHNDNKNRLDEHYVEEE
jgi:hypothetical protein